MLEKSVVVYLAHLLLTENVCAQVIELAESTDDILISNPTPGNIVSTNTNFHPGQIIGNTEPLGPANVIANAPIPDPIAASFANQENTDDVMRLTRGTLTGGNPMLSFGGATRSPITAGFTGGIPNMANQVMLEAPIRGPLPSGLGSPIETISQPISEFRPTRHMLETAGIPGPMNAMSTATITDSPFNPVITPHSVGIPTATTPITANPINAMNMANGPLVIEDLSQVSNRLVNPIGMEPIANNLPNPMGFPSGSMNTPNFPSIMPNGLNAQAALTNQFSSIFPGGNLEISKSILAAVTGIDPANLGTKARFRVQSASPISPTGLSIQAENLLMEGKVSVTGKLPFLSTVTVDGVLQDGGTGTVMYECGNGHIGITNEVPSPATMGPIAPGFGINTAFPNMLPNVATNTFGLRNSVF